jgi:hypothetical protein
MLTETDPAVLARVNLVAVLGALVPLSAAPEAQALRESVDRPTSVTLRVPGLAARSLHFSREGVVEGLRPGRRVTLAFRSPAHLNRMIVGEAQPLPLAGVGGLRFLARTFAPFADLMGRYLAPSDADLADDRFRELSTLLTLHVAVAACAQVAAVDRSGRYSASRLPDGELAIEVSDTHALRLVAHRGTLAFDPSPASSPPRAALAFRDLDVAGDVLAGRVSALACLADGRVAMRGFIPMVDNFSRILDRTGHYLGA